MSVIHYLNYLTIFIIIGFCCFLGNFVAGAKYSLVKAILRGVFCFDFWYFRWFFRNSVYMVAHALILLLIATNLSLITQFSTNNIFQKPLFVFTVSPMLWASIVALFVLLVAKYPKK